MAPEMALTGMLSGMLGAPCVNHESCKTGLDNLWKGQGVPVAELCPPGDPVHRADYRCSKHTVAVSIYVHACDRVCIPNLSLKTTAVQASDTALPSR